MAQRAKFYVLEQIYATTDDNGKVIQIKVEGIKEGKKLLCCIVIRLDLVQYCKTSDGGVGR